MFGRLFGALVLCLLCAGLQPVAATEQGIIVFAAASLKNALDEVDSAFTKASGTSVTASYAASSALAKQIEQGAPADVFVSADVQWMDYLAERALIQPNSRFNLLGNKLVLIAPADSRIAGVTIDNGFNLAKLAGDGRIAVADVRAVPAGIYAKRALESLGTWAQAEPKLAQAENVRAALALVARGEVPLGIVYKTDAMVEPKVKVIGIFPDGIYPAITYPVAVTTSAKTGAARYIEFLRSTAAKAIFERFGFSVLAKPAA